jgi:hypothetical protein
MPDSETVVGSIVAVTVCSHKLADGDATGVPARRYQS